MLISIFLLFLLLLVLIMLFVVARTKYGNKLRQRYNTFLAWSYASFTTTWNMNEWLVDLWPLVFTDWGTNWDSGKLAQFEAEFYINVNYRYFLNELVHWNLHCVSFSIWNWSVMWTFIIVSILELLKFPNDNEKSMYTQLWVFLSRLTRTWGRTRGGLDHCLLPAICCQISKCFQENKNIKLPALSFGLHHFFGDNLVSKNLVMDYLVTLNMHCYSPLDSTESCR